MKSELCMMLNGKKCRMLYSKPKDVCHNKDNKQMRLGGESNAG